MGDALSIGIASILALLAWLIPRYVAEARTISLPALALDAFPVLLAGVLLLGATGRPLLTGLTLFSLGAAFAVADRTKRAALREPVVFTDMSELKHVFTHSHLYLPFAGSGFVIGAAVAAITAGIAVVVLKPALGDPHPVTFVLAASTVALSGWALSREPALAAVAAIFRRLNPTGDPVYDAKIMGPFACLLVHGMIARAERAARRAPHAPIHLPGRRFSRSRAAVPLVLGQCESFFDARRLSPLVPSDLLPGFDACREAGATFGRLEVSAWGANTTRAEFAVLTGIPEGDLGYDRFNPYHAFARAPLASLVRELRGEGYRTICLHPYDRDFFRRDLALPALGFETFIGLETLGGSRRPPYCSDPELARHILDALDAGGPRTFIFAITMGNHGPWLETGLPIDPELKRMIDPAAVPQGLELLRYLSGLKRSDEMLQMLMQGLEERRCERVLGFYGDHVPSLPNAFRHFGFDEWSSDYILCHDAAPTARRADLPAYRLPGLIREALRAKGALSRPRAISAARSVGWVE